MNAVALAMWWYCAQRLMYSYSEQTARGAT